MKRNLPVVFLFLLIAGCATAPMPVPAPPAPPPPPAECKGIFVPGQGCKKLAAGDSGTTVRGYHEPQNPEE